MNTSVPWSATDISREAKEAARKAADRAGLSMSDWLDALIADSTSAVRSRGRVAGGASSAAGMWIAQSKVAQTSDHFLAATGTDGVPLPRTYATESHSLRTSTALQSIADQLSRFEQRSLGPVAQTSEPPSVAPSPRAASPRGTSSAGAARPTSVRDAVAEIARRQAALDADGDESGEIALAPIDRDRHPSPPRSMPGDPNPSIGALGEAVSALEARLSSSRGRASPPRREEAGADNLEVSGPDSERVGTASARRDQKEDAAFTALSHDLRQAMADLDARQVGAPQGSKGAPEKRQAAAAAGGDDLLGDIRSLLDRFRPGATLDALDRRVQVLSDRLEQQFESPASLGLIESLSRRVEEMHSALKSTAPAPDMRNFETLMRGVASRIDDARDASTNILALEGMVRQLSERVEAAATPFDSRVMSGLEAQIDRLAERLERSEASLTSLDAVERSLSELFTQIEQTRHATIDAAETAARTAARDTLRAAMQTTAMGRSPEGGNEAAERVSQDMMELRIQHEAAERRTQQTLSGLHQTMERLVGNLEALDVAGRKSSERTLERPAAQPPAEIAPQPVRAEAPPLPQGEARDRRRVDPERRAADVVVDPLDSLIEPRAGRGRGRAAEPDVEVRAPRDGASAPGAAQAEGPANFIAAARRAAQAAQASAAEVQGTRKGRNRAAKPSAGRSSAMGTLAQAKAYLAARRRPILLSLAGLVLLLGGLEIVKVGMDPTTRGETTVASTATPDAEPPKADSPGLDAGATRPDDLSPVGGAPKAGISPTPGGVPPDAVAGAGKGSGVPTIVAPSLDSPPPEKPVVRSTNPFLAGLTTGLDGLPGGLKSLANAGDAAAEYEVGLRFAEGRSVGRDPKVAADWLQKAAAQGLAPAQYRLGSAYEKGIGVNRDPITAMTLYARAADAGNVRAMHNLAVMAAEGASGKPDYAKAASWFIKASGYGVRDSQFNLAILYARGLGIEQDLGKSYMWFALAANQGDEDAAKKRDEVAGRLDAKALDAAKAAVAAFRPATPIAASNEVAPPPGGWDAGAPSQTTPLGQKTTPGKSVMM